MSTKPLWMDRFNNFVTSNTKGAEIGVYGVSGVLFALAYYRIRPLTKFGKAADIPKLFIKNKIIQRGTVKSIEPNFEAGSLLNVNHKPPLNMFAFSNKALPVKLLGAQVNSNGFSWLQSVVVDKNIRFLPVKIHADYAECRVFLLRDRKQSALDLTEILTQLGFAQIVDQPQNYTQKDLQIYIKKLIHLQNIAKKQRAGSWSLSLPPSPWMTRYVEYIIEKIKSKLLPVKYRLPEIVR